MRLILLPGMDGTGILFKPFVEKLPQSLVIEVISYPLKEKLSYRELAIFVKENLPEKEKFILLAESYSGPVAYLLAQDQAPNLKSIIFVASFLTPPRSVLLKILSMLPLEKLLDMQIPSFIAKFFMLGARIEKETLNLFKQTLEKVSGAVLAKRFREIAKLTFDLKIIDIPAIYIQGKNDKLVPSFNVEIFKQCFKGLKVYQVSGPHFILQANPEDCALIVVNELDKQTRN